MKIYRGLLEYKQLVTHYWPEFGANGKESITVETLLSHQVSFTVIVKCQIYHTFNIADLRVSVYRESRYNDISGF